MIAYEVDCENQTYDERNPSFCRGCVEIYPFHHHGKGDIQDSKLMDLVHHCEILRLVALEVCALALGQDFCYQGYDPAKADEEYGDIAVVDEETCHARPLEPPVESVQVEQSPFVLGQCVHLSREELVFDRAGLFPLRDVVEDREGPEAYSFIHVLGGYVVNHDGAGGDVCP